ncbi:MAG: cardiolipin synthase [Inconstantimicrobium porci]|uniref:Cardiolipin synthase n=1 Tax=Inconstantimicrobium porci TaxID=2652291 RepID=A0A7X2T1K9_9CLOT|nr:cardiolipin synthase [Inconstantimicrobium porci]MDD6772012.1 cardiolipin synthase [Inconstantimicrobium porci]MDY5913441.1 cardiolipin synthase [Inconstantimicrobium porci]MSR91350.1 cardiolipin synthase [Inconstantimicrobium porci]
MKNTFKVMFSRIFIVASLITLQVVGLIYAFIRLSYLFAYIYAGFLVLGILSMLWIISRNENTSYKLAWVIAVLGLPVGGVILFLIFGKSNLSKEFRIKTEDIYNKTIKFLKQDDSIREEIRQMDMNVAKQSEYITRTSAFPIYKNTFTQYLSPGEVKFEKIIEELKKAKHYIFIEYFIIEEGFMWDSVLDILIKKVREGVDVRVIYDDFGCICKLPHHYDEKLRELGIKCVVFNPVTPVVTVRHNTRDHRKILVIDGHTGFTGGINLADEYINRVERFGHWKDASIMLKGDAVWSLTVMFLQTWNFYNNFIEDYDNYRPEKFKVEEIESDGYVQPYGDSPLDNERLGEFTYLNMINRAKDYIYINTPYFIVDNEITTALELAAKSGVDVRIVTPCVPDKWYVHILTRSYYEQLISVGVKIYEYTPGFIHSKTFVCDDELGVVGTINLDFRSLYFHFECGIWLYKTKSVMEIKEDFLKTLDVCHEVTLEECRNVKWYIRIIRSFLRVFAPLM